MPWRLVTFVHLSIVPYCMFRRLIRGACLKLETVLKAYRLLQPSLLQGLLPVLLPALDACFKSIISFQSLKCER